MSTRPIVEAAIAAIEDNGNNTAVEVRDVLTKLLDYTENEETSPQPTLVPFNFVTQGPIDDNNTGSTLQYSCRGFERIYANFTFQLNISDNSDGNIFTFPLLEAHAADMLATMEAILPTDAMRFALPIQIILETDGSSRTFAASVPTNIAFSEVRITLGGTQRIVPVVRFDIDWHSGEGEFDITNARIFTSVCFHSDERIIDQR